MATKWAIKVMEIRTTEMGTTYYFQLFTKTQIGILLPTVSDDEPMVLAENDFHELTFRLSADVYNEGLQVLKDGFPLRQHAHG